MKVPPSVLRPGYDWAPDAARPGRRVQRCRGCGSLRREGHPESCALRYPQLLWLLEALPEDRQGDLIALRWSRCNSTTHVRLLAFTESARLGGLFAEQRRPPNWAALDLVGWDRSFSDQPLPDLARELARHFADEPDGPAGPGYRWERLVRCDPAGRPSGTVWVEICESCRAHAGLRHSADCLNDPDRERP